MSSRDGSDRTGRPRRSEQPNQNAAPQRRTRGAQPNWDVDPAEIDRYLSGRPSREQDSQRTQQSGGTADQINRLQRAVGGRQNPAQRSSRPSATTGREQFVQPEIDDAYDDVVPYDDEGYVEEEIRATPARQPQRQPSSTPRRHARTPGPQPEPEYDDYDEYDEYDENLIQEPAPAPRRSRNTRRQPSPQQRNVEPADTYDDELYNDDPYLDYDDEGNWNEPVAPRRSARPRPQVRLSRPNMPNVTIPKAISHADIIGDKTALALIGGNVLSLIFMTVIVNSRFDVLPQTIFTHVSASGIPENMASRDAIWRIPLMCTMLTLMAIVAAWFFAAIDQFASRFILGAALLVQFIAWIAVIRYLW